MMAAKKATKNATPKISARPNTDIANRGAAEKTPTDKFARGKSQATVNFGSLAQRRFGGRSRCRRRPGWFNKKNSSHEDRRNGERPGVLPNVGQGDVRRGWHRPTLRDMACGEEGALRNLALQVLLRQIQASGGFPGARHRLEVLEVKSPF